MRSNFDLGALVVAAGMAGEKFDTIDNAHFVRVGQHGEQTTLADSGEHGVVELIMVTHAGDRHRIREDRHRLACSHRIFTSSLRSPARPRALKILLSAWKPRRGRKRFSLTNDLA